MVQVPMKLTFCDHNERENYSKELVKDNDTPLQDPPKLPDGLEMDRRDIDAMLKRFSRKPSHWIRKVRYEGGSLPPKEPCFYHTIPPTEIVEWEQVR